MLLFKNTFDTGYIPTFINKTPSPSYLNITGSRYQRTCKYCFVMNESGKSDTWKKGKSTIILRNIKLLNLFIKTWQFIKKKSGIDRKIFTEFQYDLEKLQEYHKSLVKDNKNKGIDLDKIMPLWLKSTEKTTKTL